MTRRLFPTALVLVMLQAAAAGQSGRMSESTLPLLAPIGLPLPIIATPLPPIGLPLSSITPLPPASASFAPTGSLPPTKTPRPGDGARPPGGRPTPRGRDEGRRDGGANKHFTPPAAVIYVAPAYGYWGYPQQQPVPIEPAYTAPAPAPVAAERPRGVLRLDVRADAPQQLFVDGYFVGAPADYNGELSLEEGPHRIEVRAPGYDTLVFDVRIVADRAITYRDALRRVAEPPIEPQPAPPAGVEPATPSVFYLIPGCYLGNVPPADVVLPANCDLSKLIVRTP